MLCRTQHDWKAPVLHRNVHTVPFKHDNIVHNKGVTYFQEHTMEVLGGVTLVVMASVAGIQDGDAYNSLLQCATILNGRCLLQFCAPIMTCS